MSEFKQLNMSLKPDVIEAIKKLADDNEWSMAHTVSLAIHSLAELMERHRDTADKAADKDVAELFLRVAKAMPAGLTDETIEYAHFTNGNPALILKGWYVAEDGNGDLLTIRPDGSEAGRISDGRIEKLADLDLDGVIESLKTPEEVVLN